jgi:UDP-glucosyltransferase 73C
LPPGCENIDQVKDNAHFVPLLDALQKLADPFEAYLRALSPRPGCVIFDWCNPWRAGVVRSLGIPCLFFHGSSCFYSLCDLNAVAHGLHERAVAATDDQEMFVVPGMPVRVEVTKATKPGFVNSPGWEELRDEAIEAMRTGDGTVVNTFLDLEHQFVWCYEAVLGKPVWALGPLALQSGRRRHGVARERARRPAEPGHRVAGDRLGSTNNAG